MQGVAVMANILLDLLRNSKTPPSEATDACKHLLQLQAEGSPCMEHCAPVQLYLTTQVPHFLGRDYSFRPPNAALSVHQRRSQALPGHSHMCPTCCREHQHLALFKG